MEVRRRDAAHRTSTVRRSSVVASLVVVAVGISSAGVDAAAGDLDDSFSGDGVRRFSFSTVEERPSGLAIDPAGRIVVAGSDASDMTVARLRPNGQFDSTFSGDGRLKIDFGDDDAAASVARQGDKLLVAGNSGDRAALARLTKSGAFDGTFSGNGRLTFARLAFSSSFFAAAAPTPDGGVVAVGSALVADGLLSVLVVKYTARGQLDRSFSGDGVRVIERAVEIVAVDVIVQPDGKFLVLLYGEDEGSGILRLKRNGRTDRTYGGGDGIADLPGTWTILAMARDGTRVVVAADEVGAIRVARFKQDGSRSNSFGGGDGRAEVDQTDFGLADASDVAVQDDSRVVVSASTKNQLIIRLTASGAKDASFNGGLGFVEVGGADPDAMTNVRVDGQGRIVAAGRLGLPNPDVDTEDQVVYRFLSR
jgi:uncharacterized delta-60 repeat protein